jgi:hypothetical protein
MTHVTKYETRDGKTYRAEDTAPAASEKKTAPETKAADNAAAPEAKAGTGGAAAPASAAKQGG